MMTHQRPIEKTFYGGVVLYEIFYENAIEDVLHARVVRVLRMKYGLAGAGAFKVRRVVMKV